MNSQKLALRSNASVRWTLIAVAVMLATTLAAVARSQAGAPSESRGVTTKSLGAIDLSNEIDGMSGRELRARLVNIAPGGHIAAHSHKDRPTMEYVVEGQPVEIRNGMEIPHHAGDMVIATHDVSHAWENRESTPAVLLPVDIVRP